MAEEVRDRARQFLSEVPPIPGMITSMGKTASLFTKLTGTTDATLKANWAKGGIMTTCNGLTGMLGRAVGCKEYLGRFDLADYLKKVKKDHAWVKASDGAEPRYGDIFKMKKFHVGVSCDVDGGTWNTVESGQGGPKAGFDILKRKQQPFDAAKLEGWVDIDLYVNGPGGGSAAPSLPLPQWLLGWWKVGWRARTFYYEFNSGRKAIWTLDPSDMDPAKCARGQDVADVSVSPDGWIKLKWSASGSIEEFTTAAAPGPGQMTGWWNDAEVIGAVKI